MHLICSQNDKFACKFAANLTFQIHKSVTLWIPGDTGFTDTVTLPRTARLYLLSRRAEGTQHMLHVQHVACACCDDAAPMGADTRTRTTGERHVCKSCERRVAQPHEGRSFRRQAPQRSLACAARVLLLCTSITMAYASRYSANKTAIAANLTNLMVFE